MLSQIPLIALFASAAAAWEVAVYNDQNCNTGDSSTFDYYVISGSTNENWVLGTSAPAGDDCGFYTDGGVNGPLDCSTGSFTSSSSFVIDGGDCYFYESPSCIGEGFGSSQAGCQNLAFSCMSCTG